MVNPNLQASPTKTWIVKSKISKPFFSYNYPLRFFNDVLSKFLQSRKQSPPDLPAEEESSETEVYLRIPFMGSTPDSIHSLQFSKRLVTLFQGKFDIKPTPSTVKPVFYTFKVGDFFTLKDPVPLLFRTNFVYEHTCSGDGTISYLGMTTRQWLVRMSEHLDPTQN